MFIVLVSKLNELVTAVFVCLSCCVSPEAELTLLAFALARGSLAKIIMFLSSISDHLDRQYKASSLISSMAVVRLKLLYKNGSSAL